MKLMQVELSSAAGTHTSMDLLWMSAGKLSVPERESLSVYNQRFSISATKT